MTYLLKFRWTFLCLVTINIILLSGCAVTENIKQTDNVGATDAILVVRVHMNMDDLRVYIEEDRPTTLLTAHHFLVNMDNVSPPDKLFVVKVPAKKVFFSGTYRGTSYTKRPNYTSVKLKAGTINYIGDHYTNWDPYTALVATRIDDNETQTIALAKSKLPWLFKKYPYLKNVPELIPVDAVKGYKRVDELK